MDLPRRCERGDPGEPPRLLLARGYGITNVVERATAGAAELSREELVAGARRLEAKVGRYRPRVLAVLGIGAYRTGFGRPTAGMGRQPETVAGAAVWVLPNPSGLNASYRLPALAQLYGELKPACFPPSPIAPTLPIGCR